MGPAKSNLTLFIQSSTPSLLDLLWTSPTNIKMDLIPTTYAQKWEATPIQVWEDQTMVVELQNSAAVNSHSSKSTNLTNMTAATTSVYSIQVCRPVAMMDELSTLEIPANININF